MTLKTQQKQQRGLKIKRQKEEGTYVDPNLTTVRNFKRSGGGLAVKRNNGLLDSERSLKGNPKPKQKV